MVLGKGKPSLGTIVFLGCRPFLAEPSRGIIRWAKKSRFGDIMGLYSHYDGAHNHPVNRALHMIAIPVGFSSLIVVWWHWIIALLLIPSAFALAWLGHLIEGNKPAFLTNPAHVFVAPLWMARKVLGITPKKAM